MKRTFSLLLLAVFLMFTLVACTQTEDPTTTKSGDNVTTTAADTNTTTLHTHEFGAWTVVKNATCTEDGSKERTCACGAKETETVPATGHNYSTEWTIDVEPTCRKAGSKSHHCTVCDAKTDVTKIDKVDHTEGTKRENEVAATCTTAGTYDEVVYCTVCNKEISRTQHIVAVLDHDFSAWTGTQATCTEAGTETRTCSSCHLTETRTVNALGHNYSADWTIDTPANCTEAGSKSHHCTRCESVSDVTTIEALGHDYPENWTVVTPATETEDGLEEKECSRCHNKMTQAIPKLAKDEVDAQGALTTLSQRMGIGGYEWGPAADMIVFKVNGTIKPADITADMFSSTTANVVDAFVCNEHGVKVDTPSQYFAVKIAARAGQRSPFTYANSLNNWTNNGQINMNASLKTGSVLKIDEGANIVRYSSFSFSGQLPIADRVVPSTSTFDKRTYTDGNITLTYGSWGTDAMKNDNGKNPLIIWLHGAGEGGTDIDIALLGNDVTNLTESKVQSHFANGAYVLACQTPTMWMNDGTGNYTSTGTSMFTETLFKLIKNYCEVENTDVDLDRVYIGGCSNGGYMTINMMIQHGNYFAAAYPVCEAYSDSWITDAQITTLKDYNIWFTHSADDRTVNPANYTVATYVRLIKAGATNVYFSYFESVKGTDDPNANQAWGQGSGNYMGHYSWIYVLQDACTRVQSTTVAAAGDLQASNLYGGGKYNVMVNDEAQTIFGWMAAQKKGEKHGSAVLEANLPTDPNQGQGQGGGSGTISTLTGDKVRVEAESGVLGIGTENSNNLRVETNANASGGSGVGYFQQAGDSITLTITSPAAKTNGYIRIGAASASGSYPNITDVSLEQFNNLYTVTWNGATVAMTAGSLPGNSSANYYNVHELEFRADIKSGANTLVITAKGGGGANFDYVDIYYGEVTVTPASGGGNEGGSGSGGSVPAASGTKTRLEAESATLGVVSESNSVQVETNAAPSGGAGIGYFQQAGDSITLTFTATAAKTNADIRLGVASATMNASYQIQDMSIEQFNAAYTITLNGEAITVTAGSLPGNASWNFWDVHELAMTGNFKAGTNTIVITAKGAGGCNWDYVDVYL